MNLTQKISQMTPKGADLAATDLIEVSTLEAGSYVTKSITGQELIDAIPLPPSGLTIGTTPIASGTIGRVLFQGTGNVLQQSSSLFWDSTNNRLGVGGTPGAFTLDVNGTARVQGALTGTSTLTLGQTGTNGEVILNRTTTGTTAGGIRAIPSGTEIGGATYLDKALFGNGSGIDFFTWTGVASNTNQRMKIFATSGNVLIQNGGTFTDAGFKLDVNGTARFNVGASQNIVLGKNITYPTVPSISMNGSLSDTLMAGFFADDLNFYINSPNRIIIRGSGTANNSSFVFSNGALGQGYGAYGTNPSTSNGIFILDKLGVGTNAPAASAKAQIDSTTQGFLPPRMTTTQRNAIASPAAGLIVYDTTLNLPHFFNGTIWVSL
jgi:hypothetical protein